MEREKMERYEQDNGHVATDMPIKTLRDINAFVSTLT